MPAADATELDAFARFCALLILDNGRAMPLEDFQREALADHFAGALETLILISKKNGKSTLLAALALFHLASTPDAECVIGAASRDQATILYDQAAGFVRRSPGLAELIDVKRGYREIRAVGHFGRVRVLAADVDTADGVLPTLALVDELHRHRSAELYGVFRDGLGPRGGRMVTISTAGAHEATPLGQMRSAALTLPDVTRNGAHTVARATDRAFVMHEWALEKTADLDDMATVKLANPASWQTLEALGARHDSPSMLDWQWARFACGIWVGAEDRFLDAAEWHPLASAERLRAGDRITLGFDGSRVGDATALIACRLTDGLLQPLGVWEAPTDAAGWEVPAQAVSGAVERAFDRYRVALMFADPPLWRSEIDSWARTYGDTVRRFETSRTQMLGAIERFATDVRAGELAHTGDATLTRHVLNAQTREARTGGVWIVKEQPTSPHKIDAAVAAVLAWEARAQALAAGAGRSRKLVTF